MAAKQVIKNRWGFELLRKSVKNLKDPEARNNLYVFLICLLISLFIWLSIKLSKEYHATVEHEVNYVNIPDDKVLVNNPPGKIKLKVLGHGMELLKVKYGGPSDVLQIDVSEAEIVADEEKFKAELPTVWFISQVARQTNYYDNLIDIKPDTLLLRFEDLKYKKVPVEHQFSFKLDKQVWLRKPVRYSPDSVVVSGRETQVDTVRKVFTEPVKLGTLSSPVTRRAKLDPPEGMNFSLSNDSTTVVIPCERYTEEQVNLTVEPVTPDTVRIRTFPREVSVTYWVSLDDYQRLNEEMFQAVVSVSEEENRFLPVQIRRVPDYVKIVEVNPSEVEYIYLK
ncbi:MAG: hypothetical protein ACQESX_01250 [Bacteroidota bacterium]